MSLETFVLNALASLIGAVVGGFFTYKAAIWSMKNNVKSNHQNFMFSFFRASVYTNSFIRISKEILDMFEMDGYIKDKYTEAELSTLIHQLEVDLLNIFNEFVPDLTIKQIKRAAFENVHAISNSGPFTTFELMNGYLFKLLNLRNLLIRKTSHITNVGNQINVMGYYPNFSPDVELRRLEKDFEKLKKELAYK